MSETGGISFDLSMLKDAPTYAVLLWLVFRHETKMNAKLDQMSQLLGRAVFVIQELEKRLSIPVKEETHVPDSANQ